MKVASCDKTKAVRAGSESHGSVTESKCAPPGAAEAEAQGFEIDETPISDIGPPPDGGLTAWLQVVAGFFCLFNSYGLVNTYGVYQEYYQTELLSHKSPSEIAWIGALFGALAQFLAIAFAPLIDKGYIKYMALAGTLIQTFAMMMLGFCKEYYQVMLTQAVLLGIGASILILVGLGAVTPYFSKHRGIATGIAASGSSLGGVIYPIGLRRLVNEVGFAWSARIVGFIVLATGLLAFACVKRRLPPRKTGALIDIESVKDTKMMCYVLALMFAYICQYIVFYYLQTYAVNFSNGANVAAYTTPLLNAASALGRILPNLIADRIGIFNIMVPAITACTILGFCWIAINQTGSIIGFTILWGFFSAPLLSLQGPIVASLTPDLNRLGIRMGFAALFNGVGALLGPPMAGIVLQEHGWLWLKLFSSCSMAAGLCFSITIRQLASDGRIVKKV